MYCRVKWLSTDVSGMMMMMEAVRTSETSVDNHFKRQYIPEDNSEHHIRRRENLKSHIYDLLFINSDFPRLHSHVLINPRENKFCPAQNLGPFIERHIPRAAPGSTVHKPNSQPDGLSLQTSVRIVTGNFNRTWSPSLSSGLWRRNLYIYKSECVSVCLYVQD
jgi:hypothetical protein